MWVRRVVIPPKHRDDWSRVIFALEDVTERARVEEQLRQAQKMEAVGQLTGGIAHDFNNLLTIVLTNLYLLQEKSEVGGELLEDATDAVLRGAKLTQQLLAFSRKQTLAPEIVDVAELVQRSIGLLERTLGEEIEIRSALSSDLEKTLADPTQLETALLNIALNARDAMPTGGTLSISAANVVLDDKFVTSRPGLKPGQYILMTVTDTGTGIPAARVDQIFDPFFTTKEVGKGSGLGLSMIYGFAKQSGGHVEIESEVGSGTQVKLYLPRASAADARVNTEEKKQHVPPSGQETVLVVEDDLKVRRSAVNLFSAMGYEVLGAPNASKALALLDEVGGVDLLFSDVVMPGGMDGWTLARQARRRRPDLAVLLTTGYSRRSDQPEEPGRREFELLQKPYSKAVLAKTVRRVLDKGQNATLGPKDP